MKENESFYEQYWGSMEQWFSREGKIERLEAQIFSRLLKPGQRCVDYGCGDGLRYGKFLTELGIDYLGADISEVALKKAAEHGLRVSRLRPEDGATEYEAASFDVAFCMEVFEHLLEPGRALAELERILKPGGMLIASVPNAAYWITRVEFLLRGFLNPGGSPLTARKAPWNDPHIRFFSPATFKAMVRSGGFEVRELLGSELDLGWLPYVYRRPALHRFMSAVSYPIRWLGRLWPSLFASRLFLVAQKKG
jgi:SAM-dependent methyltransferase